VQDGERDDRRVVEILSLAGHELAQPLATALACARLLSYSEPHLSEARRSEVCTTLLRNLWQLQSLVEDLEVTGSADLLGEVNRERLAARREPLDMRRVLEHAIEDFCIAHPDCRLELSCDDAFPVKVDPPRFQQVLSNLLSNAHKFGSTGHCIRLEGHREGTNVVVSLHNEGPGFPPEEARRIFEKSVRLEELVTGHGWGLYVAKAIVEAHDGDLWAESGRGHGATFFIRMPALDDAA
jgi:signal transduction histidine kinase